MGSSIVIGLLMMFGALLVARYYYKSSIATVETEATRRVEHLLAHRGVTDAPTVEEKKKRGMKLDLMDRVSAWVKGASYFKTDEGKSFLDELDMMLVQAGMRDRYTPERALAVALVVWFFGVACPVLLIMFIPLPKVIVIAAILFFALYPVMRLRRNVQNRKDQIAAEVPFFLNDLYMALSTGALTIDQAILRVAQTSEDDPYDAILPKEFAQAHMEHTMGGKSQIDSIRAVGYRTGVPAVENFCEALIQGIRTGSEMPKVLQDYSHQAQEMWHQSMRAFKNKKESMITVGVVITMFGAFIIFATPMMIGLMDTIGGM